VAELFTVENLIALLTLTSLEVVLGIDNIVFIAIITGRLPQEHQRSTRQLGLVLAMGMRILLLLAIKWVMQLTTPLVTLLGQGFSGRDLILGIGGAFLIAKATLEIHERTEHAHGAHPGAPKKKAMSKGSAIAQILALDLVFSLDSVITAVGMAKRIEVMIAAVVIAVVVMLIFAGRVSSYIEHHPAIKMLALSFLLLIGVMLVAESFGQHVEHGYIYFAMAFSLGVELLNQRASRRHGAHA